MPVALARRGSARRLAVGLAFAGGACASTGCAPQHREHQAGALAPSHAATATSGPSRGSELNGRTVTAPPPEGALLEACVPTGPERCFDARDDNCNGIIDEGCGVRTGLVQFAIAWDAPTADVDLLVTDSRGELVAVGRPSLAGLVKERDCPGKKQECQGENYENVYLDGEAPKPGKYLVKVRLERLGDEDPPIAVTFGARLGQKTYATDIELNRVEEAKELEFSL